MKRVLFLFAVIYGLLSGLLLGGVSAQPGGGPGGILEVATFEDLGLKPDTVWKGDRIGELNKFESGSYRFWMFDYKSFYVGFVYSSQLTTEYDGNNLNNCWNPTGRGVDGSPTWGVFHYSSDEQPQNRTIQIAEEGRSEVIPGVWVNNTSWVLHAVESGPGNGDNRPYAKGDYFRVKFVGHDGDTVVYYTADYRSDDPADHYVLHDWAWVDLSPLGKVHEVEVLVEGSRKDWFGSTMPSYICIDDFGAPRPQTTAERQFLYANGEIDLSFLTKFRGQAIKYKLVEDTSWPSVAIVKIEGSKMKVSDWDGLHFAEKNFVVEVSQHGRREWLVVPVILAEKPAAGLQYKFEGVTIAQGGTAKVIYKGAELAKGSMVDAGELVTLELTPDPGYRLLEGGLEAHNALRKTEKEYMPVGDFSFDAKFVPVFELKSVDVSSNGELAVVSVQRQKLVAGAKFQYGDQIIIRTTPAAGYELLPEGLEVKGARILPNGRWLVEGDVTIKATFTPPRQFTITQIVSEGYGSVEVENANYKELKQGDKVVYGEMLFIRTYDTPGIVLAPDGLKVSGAEKQADGKWKVTGDVSVKATFVEVTRTLVSISQEGEGSVIVKNDEGVELKQGDKIRYMSMITIEAKPAHGYYLGQGSLRVTGVASAVGSSTSLKVIDDVSIKAIFTPEWRRLSDISVFGHGKVVVKDSKGKNLGLWADVSYDMVLKIEAIPNDGYELASDGLKVYGAEKQKDGTWKVRGHVSVEATFTPKKFTITQIAHEGEGKVRVVKASGSSKVLMKGDTVVFGTRLTIVPAAADGYDLAADGLKVEGADKQSDGTWQVKGDVSIKVTFTEKAKTTPTAVESVVLADAQAMPNPFTGVLQVRTSGVVARCTVWNTMGQMLYSLERPGTDFVMDLSHLPSALYLLRLEDEHGGVRELRVVKQ